MTLMAGCQQGIFVEHSQTVDVGLLDEFFQPRQMFVSARRKHSVACLFACARGFFGEQARVASASSGFLRPGCI